MGCQYKKGVLFLRCSLGIKKLLIFALLLSLTLWIQVLSTKQIKFTGSKQTKQSPESVPPLNGLLQIQTCISTEESIAEAVFYRNLIIVAGKKT